MPEVSARALAACATAVVVPSAAFGVLLAADVPFVVAGWSVLLCGWSTLAGTHVTRWCGVRGGSVLDEVAVGFGLGLFVSLVVDQIVVTGLGIVWRWTVPIVIAPLAVAEIVRLVRSLRGGDFDPTIALVVVGGALLAVGHEWLWTFPLGGVALAAAWLVHDRQPGARRLVQWSTMLVSATGTVIGLAQRNGSWWLTQNDTHFYEAVASSLGRWGLDDFALATGRSLRYHWFPYAWVGAMDRASNAADYVILTRVAPLVAGVGIFVVLAAIARRYVAVARLGWVALLFAMSPVFGDWWKGIPLAMSGSFSQFFATMWLLAVPLALARWLEHPSPRGLVLVGVLVVALVGGKATHAVIAAVLLAATWFTLVLRGDPRTGALFSGGACIAGAAAIGARWIFGGSSPLRFLPSDWLPYIQGDLYDRHGLGRLAAAIAYLAAMVAVPLIAAVWAVVAGARRSGALSITVLGAGLLLTMWSNRLYNVTPNGLFALHSAVSIVWVGGAIGVARNARLSEWRTVATAAAVGFVGAISIPSLDSGSRVAVWLRVSRTVTIYLPLLVVLIGSISRRRSLRDTLELSLTASAILMLAMQSWMVAGQVSAEYRGWRVTSINDVSPEHQVVSWIRAETPPEAVLATNHLCDVPACPEPATSAGAGFAVATGRRFLVAAPLYALAYSAESDTWRGRDRVGASIEFGRAPTSELAATLREAGVGWFVAERARSGAVDWGAVGDVRFENVDYLVIELRDS